MRKLKIAKALLALVASSASAGMVAVEQYSRVGADYLSNPFYDGVTFADDWTAPYFRVDADAANAVSGLTGSLSFNVYMWIDGEAGEPRVAFAGNMTPTGGISEDAADVFRDGFTHWNSAPLVERPARYLDVTISFAITSLGINNNTFIEPYVNGVILRGSTNSTDDKTKGFWLDRFCTQVFQGTPGALGAAGTNYYYSLGGYQFDKDQAIYAVNAVRMNTVSVDAWGTEQGDWFYLTYKFAGGFGFGDFVSYFRQTGDGTSYWGGYDYGYQAGYTEGYDNGIRESEGYIGTGNLIISKVMSVGFIPVEIFFNVMDIEVFGINISNFVKSLVTIVLILVVVRLILQMSPVMSPNTPSTSTNTSTSYKFDKNGDLVGSKVTRLEKNTK